MYFVEEMTQSAIAEALGVGRVTVVRMLAEAKALGEVRIALSRGDAELGALEAALCRLHGFSEAIVAPLSSDVADATAPIAAALGDHVSALLRNDMKIGLGWGRTLNRSLEYLSERSLKGLSVVSLVGGVTHFVARQPGRVSLRFRARLRRRLLSHSLARARRQPGDQGGLDRALRAQVGLRFRRRARRCGGQRRLARAGSVDRALRAHQRRRPEDLARIWRRRRNACATSSTAKAGSSIIPLNQRVMSVPLEAVRAAPDSRAGGRRRAKAGGDPRRAQAAQADDVRDRRGDRAQADRLTPRRLGEPPPPVLVASPSSSPRSARAKAGAIGGSGRCAPPARRSRRRGPRYRRPAARLVKASQSGSAAAIFASSAAQASRPSAPGGSSRSMPLTCLAMSVSPRPHCGSSA